MKSASYWLTRGNNRRKDCVDGLLVLNKPKGVTSRAIVDLVQKRLRSQGAGHAGTLDPMATGVLLVCVGQATRLMRYLQQLSKAYTASFLLGQQSPTEDTTGAVEVLSGQPLPTLEHLQLAAAAFVGDILQQPPAFSALKVQGKRAYKLARAGKAVSLEPRPIRIHALQLLDYNYPQLRLNVHCSAGTYVRSLGRDLAQALGTFAVMSDLERTAVGMFCVGQSVCAASAMSDEMRAGLLPISAAVAHLPRIDLNERQLQTLQVGNRPKLANLVAGQDYAVFTPSGALAAVFQAISPEQAAISVNLVAGTRAVTP